MKLRIASLALLTVCCLMLGAAPALADNILYDNGPINGTVNAWNISDSYAVSDTLVCRKASKEQQEDIGVWALPRSTPLTTGWSIGTSAFGGDIGSGTASLTVLSLFTNEFGYNVDEVSFSTSVSLAAGTTYWLTLQNTPTADGDPVYWDENSGVGCMSPDCPSQAQENTLGTIPSEAFTILGGTNPTTPEPSSIMLFGSGILGLAGVLRRSLNH